MEYASVVKKAEKVIKSLQKDDSRFDNIVHITDLSGSTMVYRSAFMVICEEYVIVFIEHYKTELRHRFVIYHLDEVVFKAQYREVYFERMGEHLYTMVGYIESVQDDMANVVLMDQSTLDQYYAKVPANVLSTVYGIKKRFGLTAIGSKIHLDALPDRSIPPERVEKIIEDMKQELSGESD